MFFILIVKREFLLLLVSWVRCFFLVIIGIFRKEVGLIVDEVVIYYLEVVVEVIGVDEFFNRFES